MPGYVRTKSRQQSQQELNYTQARFDGALNTDVPANKIESNELPVLENMYAFPDRLEGRSGTQKYTDTALPGSGTVHSIHSHPTINKWLLHRGSQLWIAPITMSAWTEVTTYSASANTSTIAGGLVGNVTNVILRGTNLSNTTNGILYVSMSNLSSLFSIYKDVLKTQLVARGTFIAPGIFYISQRNNSGIGGVGTILSLAVAIGTLTVSVESSFGEDADSSIILREKDFLVFTPDAISYVNSTDQKFTVINSPMGEGYGKYRLADVGSPSEATPYGYRFLYTFSRILSLSGGLDNTVDRRTGELIFESAANYMYNSSDVLTPLDYCTIWLANPITEATPVGVYFTGAPGASTVQANAAGHYTHTSLYRTGDIGVNGTGNNSEIYVWVSDTDITQEAADGVGDGAINDSDEVIEARIAEGSFTLNTRFWREMPSGEIGESHPNFIFSAEREGIVINYGQLFKPYYIGFHNPVQFLNVDDGLQELVRTQDNITVLCTSKTKTINPNNYQASVSSESTFLISSFLPASDTIGVTDYGSIDYLDSNAFIARCSDDAFRIFQGTAWQDNDFAEKKIGNIVASAMPASVGVYSNREYYFFYRTDSSQTINNKTLRLGLGKNAGYGWSTITGNDWIQPALYSGAVSFYDTHGVKRILALDDDGFFYWIGTFEGYTGSNLTKVYKDKVAVNGVGGTAIQCKFRTREVQGSQEDFDCILQESHVSVRPVPGGYPTGFQLNVNAYINGIDTIVDSITDAPYSGDIQFFNDIEGNSFQLEYVFLSSGFKLTSTNITYYSLDRKNIINDITTTDQSQYQTVLLSNLSNWLTRDVPIYRDRASQTNGVVAGSIAAAPGPDGGLSSAMTFSSSSSLTVSGVPGNLGNDDFTLSFWVKTPVLGTNIITIAGTFPLTLKFVDNTTLNLYIFPVTVTTVVTGWHFFVISCTSGTISIYQNMTFLGDLVSPGVCGGSTLVLGGAVAPMYIFDLRIYEDDISTEALTYYYNDVLVGGNLNLPSF